MCSLLVLKLTLYFSYVIERGVCFLSLCEQSFSKRLAFAFLEDLQTEFTSNYGQKVDSVSRPYSFIEFGELHLTHTHLNNTPFKKNLSTKTISTFFILIYYLGQCIVMLIMKAWSH